MRRLAIRTVDPIQLIDITDEAASFVRSTGTTNGLVSIVSRHTTMAVRIQEAEPLLLEDLLELLRRLAPSNACEPCARALALTHLCHQTESVGLKREEL